MVMAACCDASLLRGAHSGCEHSAIEEPCLDGRALPSAQSTAYLAVCLVVRDQHADIREWLHHHMALGVGRFYIFDNNSTTPMLGHLEDLVRGGVVEYHFLTAFRHHSNRTQLHVYDTCIQRFRTRHRWIAFIDADEFFVLRDPSVPSLPALLEEFEDFGALAVNWQVVGSSGHVTKPAGGTLAAYTRCLPASRTANRHVKAIANMQYVRHAGVDPHSFVYKDGKFAVNSACEAVGGAMAERAVHDRVALNHYVTKSRTEYADKMVRGSAMGNQKTIEFFDLIEGEATAWLKPLRNDSELIDTYQRRVVVRNSVASPVVPSPSWLVHTRQLSVQQFPALNLAQTPGIAELYFQFQPCTMLVPHSHPRGDETVHGITGKMKVSVINEAVAGHIVNQVDVGALDVSFVPQGNLHFYMNDNCDPATMLATFNNGDPGTVVAVDSLLMLADGLLSTAFGVKSAAIASLRSTVTPFSLIRPLSEPDCYKRCNLAGRDATDAAPENGASAAPRSDSDPDFVAGEWGVDSDSDWNAAESDDEDGRGGRHARYSIPMGVFHIRRGAAEEPLRRLQRLHSLDIKPLVEPVAALVNQKTAATDDRHPCPERCEHIRPSTGCLSSRAAGQLGPPSGVRGGFSPAQRCHVAAFHLLPTSACTIVENMHSRAYTGQFSASGDLFVAAFQHERRIRMYDVEAGWALRKDVHCRNLRWTVTDTCSSPDQIWLAYATINPTVHLVNANVGGVRSEANVTDIHEALHFDSLDDGQSGTFGIWSLKWSADGREIIAGTGDSSVYVYDIERRKSVMRIPGHEDDVNAVAFMDALPHVIASGSDDTLIKIWDRRALGRGAKPAGVLVGHTEGLTYLDSRGDGRHLLSNAKDQTAKMWDLRKMLSAAQHGRLPPARNPNFEWDYRWMEYPARGYLVPHPHDVSLQTYRGHSVSQTLIRAYFSPASTTAQRYVYAGSADGAVRIWDVVTAKEVAALAYHREIVRDCSWHPTLPLLASVSWDGTIVTWGPPRDDPSTGMPEPGWDTLEDNF
ncbi:hypothetical protein WJX81_003498 [Elliptochloris bilobata]|uniref:Cupin type-1 domain-containing protein n=1 Tax=Elliptochloris bilobata TaxID=381761 RepID=A0AAW1RMC4_9CHLO